MLTDRCNISDRDAVRTISDTSEGLSHDIQNLTISRSIIRVHRQKFQKQRAQIIKNSFTNVDFQGAVINWNSKLLLHIEERKC